jgi:hypothetical protein
MDLSYHAFSLSCTLCENIYLYNRTIKIVFFVGLIHAINPSVPVKMDERFVTLMP